MERKRKLPARAAARVDQLSKRRTLTPPERRSETPAPPPPEPELAPVRETPAPLPRTLQPGKPLPTVEDAQPSDLSDKKYQSIAERNKWVSEGIFEKYWTKPSRRKTAATDEANNNPPKESMTKVGQVVITVEPHVFEATMFVVKDPKPPAPVPPPASRPVIQYGPPNGVMPPPPPPPPPPQPAPSPTTAAATASSPPQTSSLAAAQIPKLATAELASQSQSQSQTQTQTQPQPHPQPPPPLSQPLGATPDGSRPAPSATNAASKPIPSPRAVESSLPHPSAATPAALPAQHPLPSATPGPAQQPHLPRPSPSPAPSAATPTPIHSFPATGAARPPSTPLATPAPRPAVNGTPATGSASKPAPGTDPIILTLAERAGEDPQLRDLMKRVAQGDAAKHELERFQAIIDEITAESKRRGTPQGPSADRLLVDGRTVRYFADEVRTILDIVLASNPRQTSADLRPPPGSDPLVVLLVKTALDEFRTRDMVRRIAENRAQFSDATDLKSVLDRLKHKIVKDLERRKTQSPAVPSAPSAPAPRPNGVSNGRALGTPSPVLQTPHHPPQQALRSKGPPPPPKHDISAVVFEFAGGTGDRYLFPKFSILENVPLSSGQQIIASFLIVRKGSASEYPVADPNLDFYQPVTMRLFASSGRHLENLARVVAPQEEVRRYMDDIMDKMTRAEYVLLAMRLPRGEPTSTDDAGTPAVQDAEEKEDKPAKGAPPQKQGEARTVESAVQQPSVLWTAKAVNQDVKPLSSKSRANRKSVGPDEQYQKLIASVSKKEIEET